MSDRIKQPTLYERLERRARERHLELVPRPLDDADQNISRKLVRPLGVAPERWIVAKERGTSRERFSAVLHALADDVIEELFGKPPRAA